MSSKLVKRHTHCSILKFQVQIGFDAKGRYDFRCVGSIITTQLILTTASCFDGKLPLVVRLSVNDTIVPIRAKVQHKNYNATDKSNDVAIIQLMNPLVWDSYIFPTCLWMNQTHTPLVMRLIQLGKFVHCFNNILITTLDLLFQTETHSPPNS